MVCPPVQEIIYSLKLLDISTYRRTNYGVTIREIIYLINLVDYLHAYRRVKIVKLLLNVQSAQINPIAGSCADTCLLKYNMCKIAGGQEALHKQF